MSACDATANGRSSKKGDTAMSPEAFEIFFMSLTAFATLSAFLLYWLLSSHRRQQEKVARKVLVQFADYMLAHLMSPEEVTLIKEREEFSDDKSFDQYRRIYVEASRLSARQNLTGEDLSRIIENAKKNAEELRRSS
jgi:hypothetical protein